MRTPGTPRDNLFPRASSEFRAVVTKGSRTAETALYSSRGMQEAVQDRHEGSGAQQRDGELQSSTESSREGIADLHRVMLAVRVICQVRGPTTPSGVGPFSRWKATPTHTRHRWPDRRSRQPSTLQARYAIWACHCFTSVPPASRSPSTDLPMLAVPAISRDRPCICRGPRPGRLSIQPRSPSIYPPRVGRPKQSSRTIAAWRTSRSMRCWASRWRRALIGSIQERQAFWQRD